MADVGADQVGLVPAHQHAGEAEHHRRPAQLGADRGAEIGARQQAAPVEQRGQEEHRAHPQDRRLAGQQVFQEKLRLAISMSPPYSATADKAVSASNGHQRAHRLPVPAEPGEGRRRGQQDGFFVVVHVGTVTIQGEQRAGQQCRRVQPVERRQAPEKSGRRHICLRSLGCCLRLRQFHHSLHSPSGPVTGLRSRSSAISIPQDYADCCKRALSVSKSLSKSSVLRCELIAIRACACVSPGTGLTHTHRRRSRMYSIENTPSTSRMQPR